MPDDPKSGDPKYPDDPKYIVRTWALADDDGFLFRHPKNPNSEFTMWRLGDRVGMQRVPLNLIRIPPGKENFLPHAHAVQEEYVFVLEGDCTMQIGDQEVAVGPGDYIGFPTDGTVHHLVNTGSNDLLYLTGGERTDVEVARFPTLGQVGVVTQEGVQYFDEASSETLDLQAFLDAHKAD